MGRKGSAPCELARDLPSADMAEFPINRAILTLCVLLASTLIACAPNRAGYDEPRPGNRPGDFALGVVVRGDRGDRPTDHDARYILDSDGVLGASYGAGSSLRTDPGFTRRLTPAELDNLWALVGTLVAGSDQAPPTLGTGAPDPYDPEMDRIVVESRAQGADRVLVFARTNPDASRLVDALAELAWAGD